MSKDRNTFSYIHREQELMKQGLSFLSASAQAYMEQGIAHWPEEWGDDLEFLIYGDFQPPSRELALKSLGIIVYPEPQDEWLFKTARTVLRAKVKVAEKTITGVIGAVKRINILLGAHHLVEWGNEAIGWWSQITHFKGRGGFGRPFDLRPVAATVESLLRLQDDVRKKVEWAMFWTHAAKQPSNEIASSDVVFRRYTAYWNALECLVDAVSLLHPTPNISKTEKQRRIDQFFSDAKAKPTIQDIEECYRTIVDPGFVAKARHVFWLCFEDDADRYVRECFKAKNRKNSLYDIRNSINHADVDPSDPFQTARVQQAAGRLHTIVWRLFGQILHFYVPDDKNGKFGVPLDEYTFEHPHD